jgi:hypothetical protein
MCVSKAQYVPLDGCALRVLQLAQNIETFTQNLDARCAQLAGGK